MTTMTVGYMPNDGFDFDRVESEIKETGDSFTNLLNEFINVVDDKSYEKTLALLEHMLDHNRTDTTSSIVVTLLTDAIEKYENTLEEVIEFEKAVDDLDPAISTLRLLMSQHNLKNKDMTDLIGGESLVSMILKGGRELTRKHIDNLSKHFGVNPALFF